jgi:hypothetical protein
MKPVVHARNTVTNGPGGFYISNDVIYVMVGMGF